MSERTIRVLVVDDNPGDILLVQEAFEELHVEVEVLQHDVLAERVRDVRLPLRAGIRCRRSVSHCSGVPC